MSDSYVQVFPDSTGKQVDTSQIVVNGQTVQRQRMIIGDPTQPELFVGVTAAGALPVDPSAVTSPIVLSAPIDPSLLISVVNVSTSGDHTIVASVIGQTVRVFKMFLVSPASVVVTPKDGASTALSGPLTLGNLALDFDTMPWFTTSPGNEFVLNLGASVQVSGTVYYTQA